MTCPRLSRLAALLPVAFLAMPALALAAPATADDHPAVRQFGACLAAQKTGELLLLMDQSASLKTTDPTGIRASAASYLLGQLAGSMAATNVTLDVAIAGFDVGYRSYVDWTKLNTSSVERLQQSVDSFRSRDTGLDTDYVAATEGAREAFRSHAAPAGTCRAVLWFTDGEFSINQRRDGSTKPYAPEVGLGTAAGVKQAVAKGENQICRAGGAADQLRATGALVLAEGLGTGKDQSSFDFLRSVATGRTDGGQTCGRATGTVTGEFDYAQNVDQLLFAFDAVGDPARPPTTLDTGACAKTMCAQQTSTFALDTSIRSVHILAGANTSGIDMLLRGPDGATRRFLAGSGVPSGTFDGAGVSGHWLSGRTLDLTLTRADDRQWTGTWGIAFVDPTPPVTGERGRLQIRIIGDLVPAVLNGGKLELRTGSPASLKLGVVSEQSGGQVRPDALPAGVAVSAELRADDQSVVGSVGPLGPAALATAVPMSLAQAPIGAGTLRLTLTSRIGTSPIRPADRVIDLPVHILPPLNYPNVTGNLDFGREREGVGPFPAALTITGPGCVWVSDSAASAAPDRVGTAVLTAVSAKTAASCQDVAAGASARLPVQLTLGAAGTGTVAGKVAIHLAPHGQTARAISANVDFIADVEKPPVKSVRIAAFVIALVVGLGLPMIFLYLTKWWTARIPGRALMSGITAVEVRDGSVTRDGRPFTVDGHDMEFVPVNPRGTRRLALPQGGAVLTARMGLSPTAAGHVDIAVPGMTATTGGSGKQPARLPLAVQDSWIALDGSGRVEVLVLASPGNDDAYYARLSDKIRAALPRLVSGSTGTADLAQVAPPQGGAPPAAGGATTDWWGT
ncbi:MAG: hypothetical protein QOH97_3967 [Actinoplanes sp.]|jgi:hypothetical protein|nr:hypothetical protein [Actinoplanes sp.]